MKLSAIINTRNEAANIVRCLRSISPHVDEIVIVDMESTDETVKLAKEYTKKIFKHKHVGYVEPARNFGIGKATGDWIFILDADEVVPESLGLQLRKLAETDYSYYRISRKNIIFNSWITHSGWWPDYQIRFFQKGSVGWGNEIHSIPVTQGLGTDLPAEETSALLHYNYQTIEQFLERLNRYSSEEAKELVEKGQKFAWKQLILKPSNEFLTRFFMWEGYKDGVHGLALSLLQAFSVLVVYLKVWQAEKFTEFSGSAFLDETMQELNQVRGDVTYWYHETKKKGSSGATKQLHRLRQKIRL